MHWSTHLNWELQRGDASWQTFSLNLVLRKNYSTPLRHAPAILRDLLMSDTKPDNPLKILSARIDTLSDLAARVLADNKKLRAKELALLAERDELQRKNELAKARVEAIILRLKALEAQE